MVFNKMNEDEIFKMKIIDHLIKLAFSNSNQNILIAELAKKVFELEMKIEEMEKK